MNSIVKTTELAGRKLSFFVNTVAQQATSTVITQYGETTIMTTIVVGTENKDLDYFPLYVEYVEKLYAGGRIKGSRWVKREGRPNDSAILTGRLIDRSVRPLFTDGFRSEIQIVNTVLSVDGENSPEITAVLSAACALNLCSLPWNGPIATIKLGHLAGNNKIKSHFVISPTSEEENLVDFEIIISTTKKEVVMIEAKGSEVEESLVTEGIKLCQTEANKIIKLFEELKKEQKVKPFVWTQKDESEKNKKLVLKKYKTQLMAALEEMGDKKNKETLLPELKDLISEELKIEEKELRVILSKIFKELMKEKVLQKGKRIDNRAFDKVRPLDVKVGFLPRTHGSAIFSRGATQVLAIATLGPLSLQQWIENPEGEFMKRYIHHYTMPPYSVGEVGRIGYPSRREIGHGALAEKAVEPLLPSEEEFPYTVRVASEVLSSNGSTSMASACASSLALMDAGVPIKEQVAGIAIGLVRESDEKYQLLMDIAGVEDYFGEMDFKIAGTKNGITAIQLDVKSRGLNMKIIQETLELGKKARLGILKVMDQALAKPRKELSKHAPRVVMVTPPKEKIGEIIGPGGKNIRKLITETGCEIDVGEDGRVSISGIDPQAVEDAAKRIKSMSKVYKVGEVYQGKVVKVLSFGAIVEIAPGKEGLLHVSRMGMGFVKDASEVIKVDDKVETEIAELDDKGRIKLKLVEKK